MEEDDGAGSAPTGEDRIILMKRPAEGDGSEPKRLRLDTEATLALVEAEGIERSSNMLAPTMQLSGHEAAVYSIDFNPTGQTIASGSFDRSVYLWNVYGECENYNVLRGHKNAVLQLKWAADGRHLVTASADKTVGWWDAHTGVRKKSLKGHTGVVNACAVLGGGAAGGSGSGSGASGGGSYGSFALFSGSDDRTARHWDPRARRSAQTFEHEYQVLALAVSDDGSRLYTAGIDNDVHVWDCRKEQELMRLQGHTDTITGLSLSPAGTHLLSNGMDNCLREWDVRPFAAGQRCVKAFQGITHGAEKNLLRCSWSTEGLMVAGGSADRAVHIFDQPSGQELYFLPGHTGPVTDVTFHPTEPIIASCGGDKQIFLGEL